MLWLVLFVLWSPALAQFEDMPEIKTFNFKDNGFLVQGSQLTGVLLYSNLRLAR